ncbi:MAG: hypothetical protein WA879_01940, partial [Candidatus Acidiferrales bacterium]
VPPVAVVAGYASIGAIVLTSPGLGVALGDAGALAVVDLGCCGCGLLVGVFGFLSPHIYPP